jgi:bifunctional DNA-binding transcriptional regulator/antitoxin component of YhaV-PrlF toxin-antitoxin module
MKVLFETKKVQKTGRVALNEQLLRNAGLQEGDTVDIYFDASSRRIILERAAAPAPAVAVETPAPQARQARKVRA